MTCSHSFPWFSITLLLALMVHLGNSKGVDSGMAHSTSNRLFSRDKVDFISNNAKDNGQYNRYRLFRQENHTEVDAQVGATAQMHCALTDPLADQMVSWVRRRDYHLLTVGRHIYTSDDRFGVKVSPDASDWILTLRWVDESDAGQYECQVSSHPPQALILKLRVKVAWAEIDGPSERYIHSGSSLRLVCVLKDITEQPSYVFWYRQGRMINYDAKTGVTVETLKGSSVLSVGSVTKRDQGNYSCEASNTKPATVFVHVVKKENPAGLQQDKNSEESLSKRSKKNKGSGKLFYKGRKSKKVSKLVNREAAAASSSGIRPKPTILELLYLSKAMDYAFKLFSITLRYMQYSRN